MAVYRVPVRIAFTGSGAPGANVWHLRTVAEPFAPGPDVNISGALSALQDFYLGCASAIAGTLSIDGEITEITPGGEADPQAQSRFVQVTPWTVQAGTGDESLPDLLAITVTLRTEDASRRGRGRVFLGPVKDETLASGGTPSDIVLQDIRNAAAALVDASTAATGWAWTVYSRADGVARDITSTRVRDVYSYLSSRRQ
jgi:hypothetical protein